MDAATAACSGRHYPRRVIIRSLLPVLLLCAAGCWSAAWNRESADAQVYPILDTATAAVTGQHKTFPLERPVDTLRKRLLTSATPVTLSLLEALDVAAENSRDFQRQKELLYLSALNLTRNIHDFEVQWGDVASGEVSGVANDSADVKLSNNLSASANSVAGTRVVASFINTFLRSIMHGGSFDGSSILNLTLTQPLLRGAGSDIVREPLTQSERDVVYAVRSFEHFRSTFTVQVVSDYYDVVRQVADLANVEANYKSRVTFRELTGELFNAGRKTIVELGLARQDEYTADSQRVLAKNRLQQALDQFKLTLGLPTTAVVQLDQHELDRLTASGVAAPVLLDEGQAIALALARRYDHRTVVDQVEDAGRRVMVSEDALRMILDFTAALNVPAETGKGLNLDWSRVNWAAGFNLDLALDKLVERNAYRAALISLDVSIRAREQSEDQIAADVRTSLRNIQSAYETYLIQVEAVRLAAQRVDATTELFAAGRVQARDKSDAQDSLLQAQLALTAAIVAYTVARLELMRDLEALALEPKGLRFDPALPVPEPRPVQEKP